MTRPIQEINAGSMADIAFLLLIFFLVTTTMDVDSGITRKLPPIQDEKEPDPDKKIRERDVYVVLINQHNQLAIEGELMQVNQLCDGVKEFINNLHDNMNLSERKKLLKFLSLEKCFYQKVLFPCKMIMELPIINILKCKTNL